MYFYYLLLLLVRFVLIGDVDGLYDGWAVWMKSKPRAALLVIVAYPYAADDVG